MIYVALLTLALLAVLAACVIAWAWFPTAPERDYVAEIKLINVELAKQMASYNKFENDMAELYTKIEHEGEET